MTVGTPVGHMVDTARKAVSNTKDLTRDLLWQRSCASNRRDDAGPARRGASPLPYRCIHLSPVPLRGRYKSCEAAGNHNLLHSARLRPWKVSRPLIREIVAHTTEVSRICLFLNAIERGRDQRAIRTAEER